MACLLITLGLTGVFQPITNWNERQLTYHPTSLGARRVYVEDGREWTEVVTAVEHKGQDRLVSVGRVGGDGRVTPWERVSVSAREVVRLEHEGRRDDPPLRLLVFPARPGDSRTWKTGAAENYLGRWDWVAVPAGVYECSVVWVTAERDRRSSGGLALPLEETRWYAPGVGLVRRRVTVRGETEPLSEQVLKSFTPGTK